MKKQSIIAVSGIKNSGKTTLIEALLPLLTEKGLRVAVIKHDGHDFEADVPGTDSYRHAHSGAYGTAVFSDHRYMIIKQQERTQISEMIRMFPEADLIILEGMKNSRYPKLELIRKGISDECICESAALLGVVSDLERDQIRGIPEQAELFRQNDYRTIAEYMMNYMMLGSKAPN